VDGTSHPRKSEGPIGPTHTQGFASADHPPGRTTPDRHWPMEPHHVHDATPPGYGMFSVGAAGYGMHPGPGGFPPGYHPHHPHHPHHLTPSPYGGAAYGYPPVMGLPPGLVSSGQDDIHRHSPHPSKPPSEPSSSPTSMTGSVSKRKAGPKAWTKEEDAKLLSIVQSMRMPMKWSIVAQSLPDRTGKQCRERYVNHLNPRLKVTDWSPVEDATIFYFYNISGSHWAKMSRGIPGRTDNGIKNRFHNLRRQLEREDEHRLRLSTAENFPEEIRLDRIRDFPEKLQGKAAELWEMKNGIGVLAAQSVLGGSISRNSSRFGPFRKAQDGDMCVRCGMLLPSLHTGTELCTKSGWCQSCTRIPPHICCNLLRECLNLRREQDTKLRDIIESWEEHFDHGDDHSSEGVKSEQS
jgi:Myb-like DNA-binding domain